MKSTGKKMYKSPFSIRGNYVLLMLFGVLASGCASAPNSHTDLPIDPMPKYVKSDIPQLKGVLAKLPGKMYVGSSRKVAFIANSDNTALYAVTQISDRWALYYLIQWSVYDKAYCLLWNEEPDKPRCAVELGDNAFTTLRVPEYEYDWAERISLEGGRIRIISINPRDGQMGRPFETDLQPITVAAPDLAEAVAAGRFMEGQFQETVSYATRDHIRWLRWRQMKDEDQQSIREFNAFLSGLNEQLEEANREAAERVTESTASLNRTLARIREQERAQQMRTQDATNTRASAQPRPSNGVAGTHSGKTVAMNGRAIKQATDTQQSSQDRATPGKPEKSEEETRAAAESENQRQLARQKRERAYLAGLTKTIRMAAKTCGSDDVRVGGVLPGGPRVVENIRVNFTAQCPGRTGIKGSINHFLGDGYSCVGSDMINIKLSCEAEKARVSVDSVTAAD
jgi:hypothetical protein